MSTLIAPEVTLAELRNRFGMSRSADSKFFSAEFASSSELTEVERIALDRVQ